MSFLSFLYNPDNPHRFNPEAHWRLYHPRGRVLMAVCVQDFDYMDYDPTRFVTTEAFASEEAALAAIDTLRAEARQLLEGS